MDLKTKLASRKFWVTVAAFLASIGASIAGLATGDATLTHIGAACTVISAAIYAAVEAWVDASRESSTTTSTSISATGSGANAIKTLTDSSAKGGE